MPTWGFQRAMLLSAPKARNSSPSECQSAAAGFLLPPIEIYSDSIFILATPAVGEEHALLRKDAVIPSTLAHECTKLGPL